MKSLSALRASNPKLYDEFTAICGADSAQVWNEIQAEVRAERRGRCVHTLEHERHVGRLAKRRLSPPQGLGDQVVAILAEKLAMNATGRTTLPGAPAFVSSGQRSFARGVK